jgi:hypothetical protein
VILRLTDGQIVQEGQGINSPRVLSFASHDLPIDLPKIEQFRQRGTRTANTSCPNCSRSAGTTSIPSRCATKAGPA